jgi:hypothetical protein
MRPAATLAITVAQQMIMSSRDKDNANVLPQMTNRTRSGYWDD